jgi:hypothetical protein
MRRNGRRKSRRKRKEITGSQGVGTTKNAAWVVITRIFVDEYRRFSGTYYLHSFNSVVEVNMFQRNVGIHPILTQETMS